MKEIKCVFFQLDKAILKKEWSIQIKSFTNTEKLQQHDECKKYIHIYTHTLKYYYLTINQKITYIIAGAIGP